MPMSEAGAYESLTVERPWSLVWWPSSWTLSDTDPSVVDGRDRIARSQAIHGNAVYNTDVDWALIMGAVRFAAAQCLDAGPLVLEMEVQLLEPLPQAEGVLAEQWLSTGGPKLYYRMSQCRTGRSLQDGRHRLWAARDHLKDAYPLRGQQATLKMMASGVEGAGLIQSGAEALDAELRWLQANPEHPLAAENQHLIPALTRAIKPVAHLVGEYDPEYDWLDDKPQNSVSFDMSSEDFTIPQGEDFPKSYSGPADPSSSEVPLPSARRLWWPWRRRN